MKDATVHQQIEALVAEEHELWDRNGLDESERARLREINVTLDRLYDLLHQRTALRDAGKDPDEARMRPARIVERYEN